MAIPATAHAAFAKVDTAGKLTFTAMLGEANNLSVTTGGGGSFRLAESGHLGPFPILIAGSGGCSGLAAQITCTGASSVALNTGDGDDHVAARDGVDERIACGAGTDSVTADAGDVVGADCESVDRPATAPVQTAPGTTPGRTGTDTSPPAGGGDPAGVAASPFVNIQPPVIPAQTVAVTPSGVARVQVECPVDAGSCRGSVALVLVGSPGRARVVAAAKPVHGIKLGGAKFTAKAGEKPFVQIRLNRRGRRRILRTRHTRCRIVVTTRSADGKVVTTSRDITLRARRTVRPKAGRHR